MEKEITEILKAALEYGFHLNFKQYQDLLEYIEKFQKKVELGEHYKHLYSELKKQKNEITEYIKSFEYYIPEDNKNELLRMLGEIDNE